MARSAIVVNQITSGEVAIEDSSLTTGQRFFVHANGTNTTSGGRTPENPLASFDYAIGLCTANKNDTIYGMPGHTETITTAGAIAADVAGISIIGLGNGSNRPTITFGGTAATIAISAANVLFKNIRCTCSIDEVVKLFDITGAHATLDTVDYFETATFQAIQFALLTSATNATIRNCSHYQTTAAAADQKWIQWLTAHRLKILDNVFHLTLKNAATCITLAGTDVASTGITIARNTIVQQGGTTQTTAVIAVAGSTGFVHDNRVAAAVTALPGIMVGDNLFFAENYVLNTIYKSGILDPVADS